MPYVEAGGLKQYYELDGHGPTIVLIHGHTLSLRMWDCVAPVLARHFRVIRYDIRGHGRSDAPPSGYHWQSYADDLVSLLEHLEVEGTCLIGFSLGGGVAIETALSFPELVNGLVLVDSVLNGFKYSEEFRQLGSSLREAVRRRGVLPALEEVWLPGVLFAHLKNKPGLRQRLRTITSQYSGADLFDTARPLPPPTRHIDRLEEITLPTLVVAGNEDMEDFRRIARILGDGIPGSKLVELAGAGHMSLWEKPDEFLAAVLPFLANAYGLSSGNNGQW